MHTGYEYIGVSVDLYPTVLATESPMSIKAVVDTRAERYVLSILIDTDTFYPNVPERHTDKSEYRELVERLADINGWHPCAGMQLAFNSPHPTPRIKP